MRLRVIDGQSFAAGLLFVAIGLGAASIASGYRMGSALHMGPGYYPFVVAGLLTLMGMAAILRGLVVVGAPGPRAGVLPAVMVPLAVLAFAVSVERLGLVAAVVLSVLVAGLAARPFSAVRTGGLAVLLAVLAAGIFVFGLKLPFSLFG